MTNSDHLLLQLLGQALNPSVRVDGSLLCDADWQEVIDLAFEQGVDAISVDGYHKWLDSCGGTSRLETDESLEELKFEWFGSVLQSEEDYRRSWGVACELSRLWASEGIRVTVLKGRSIARYYPKPSHRYSCDLDVFIPAGGDWEKACELLKGKGIKLEYEVYKEVEFTYKDVYVECHRYITPVRGNRNLLSFERYLRSLLEAESGTFEGTSLVCPPLMFTVMLYIEHALGDLLHGKLSLKHVVDWVVLRKQPVSDDLMARCREFRFERFLNLINALADVVEGKKDISDIPESCQEVFEEILRPQTDSHAGKTWFQRRVTLFFEIIRNRKMYQNFGYCSMSEFLFGAVWTHFFRKEVRLHEIGAFRLDVKIFDIKIKSVNKEHDVGKKL